jgi:hypothetical protein
MTKETIKKIIDDLSKVDHVIKNCRETGILPNIERDIVLTKLRSIYELILEQTQQVNPADNCPEALSEKISAKPEIVAETLTAKENKVPADIPVEITSKNGNSQIQTAQPAGMPVSNIGQNVKPTTKHVAKTEILADKFEQKNFLNEALTQYKNMFDIAKKLQNQPIQNISSAINLNDRYLFIKELFNNDNTLYQKTIERINSAANFNDAIQYIDQNFSWDFDDVQVQKLLEIVHRRFIHKEGA